MLVLTRRPDETIRIGDNVWLKITSIGPKSVRIGFDAPPDVNIVRGELLPGEPVNAETEVAVGSVQ